MIGCSRVYLGVHWPSDVLASAVLAAAWTLALFVLLRWAVRRDGDDRLASLRAALGLPNHSP